MNFDNWQSIHQNFPLIYPVSMKATINSSKFYSSKFCKCSLHLSKFVKLLHRKGFALYSNTKFCVQNKLIVGFIEKHKLEKFKKKTMWTNYWPNSSQFLYQTFSTKVAIGFVIKSYKDHLISEIIYTIIKCNPGADSGGVMGIKRPSLKNHIRKAKIML